MALDTRAAVSLISWGQHESSVRHVPLQPPHIKLRTSTGEPLTPEQLVKVQVSLNKQAAELPLYVVKVDAPPLFGREWLRAITELEGFKDCVCSTAGRERQLKKGVKEVFCCFL